MAKSRFYDATEEDSRAWAGTDTCVVTVVA